MITGFFLLLYLIVQAPKLLVDFWLRGKKHPGLLQRLGFSLPKISKKPVLWIHGVSVGEIKSAQSLYRDLRKKYPDAYFLITNTTATGHEESMRSLSGADGYLYLPVDFKWVVRKWVKHFQPKLFLLIESDFWPNLLSILKKSCCRNILVSGKMSERSFRRFHRFSFFARRLFFQFDALCVQNEDYYNRFRPFVADPNRLFITGNLKMDIPAEAIDRSFWRDRFPDRSWITISCTHAPEEEMILKAIEGIECGIFLVPRHPERFEEVAALLSKLQIPFTRWNAAQHNQKLILVDAMGRLPICYAFSRLAIVGGSYVPIGGHNILEPCLYQTPVLFGPHMFTQTEFVSLVLESKAGLQVPLEELRGVVSALLHSPAQIEQMQTAARFLIEKSRGATSRIWDCIGLKR